MDYDTVDSCLNLFHKIEDHGGVTSLTEEERLHLISELEAVLKVLENGEKDD